MSPTQPWLLVLCHEFPPLGGGCGRNLAALCQELVQRGVRLEVWTMAPPAEAEPSKFPFVVRTFATGRKAVFETRVMGLFRYALAAWRQGKTLSTADARPNAVFSAMGFPAGGVGTLLARSWEVPHFIWYHGSDVHSGRTSGPGLPGRVYLRWLFRHARANFFISRDLQYLAEKAGRPADPQILPSTISEEIRKWGTQSSHSQSPGYFLWAGRLEPVKNPLLAVHAFRTLSSRGDAPRWRIAGDGSLRAQVMQALTSSASGSTLEAPIPANHMPQALAGAIAIVLTSRVEGFSTLLLEAACLGVPAIACDVPGVREFLQHEGNGLLVPPENPDALAAALLRLWRDPALRQRLGAAARRDAEKFTPARNADGFLDALRRSGTELIASGAA